MQADDPLLEKGYKLSQFLGGRERLFYWSELCRVSVLVDLPLEKIRENCFLPFDLAASTPELELRIAVQKNALAEMSSVAPRLAIELFPQIEVERPTSSGMLAEDIRSDALEPIFLNLVAGTATDGVSIAKEQAERAATEGQYPYRAMADVLRGLPKSRKREANSILRDALFFYARETGYYNRDEEFLVLLRSLKDSAVDHSLAGQAVAAFVKRLKNDPIRIPGNYYSEIHTAKNQVFSFTDRNQAFLFQAFPEIRRFNPIVARQLQKRDPSLRQAVGSMRYVSGGFVRDASNAQQVERQHLQWIDESLANKIRELQECDPTSAVSLAEQLKETSSRVVAVSASISGIARNNPSDARNLYEQQLSAVETLDKPFDKLRAMVALVDPAYHVGDIQQYESLANQSFDLGVQLFSADTSANQIQNRRGFAELRDLITFIASRPENVLKAKVRQLPDDWLKAYLWLYEEEGHVRTRGRPRIPTDCRN